MENYFPFHHISQLENMIINILSEGTSTIWQLIEKEKDPLKRCKQRKLYFEAMKKIRKK